MHEQNREPEHLQPLHSRRELMAAAAVGVLGVLTFAEIKGSGHNNAPGEAQPQIPEYDELYPSVVFDNEKANKLAAELDLVPGSYYSVNKGLVEAMTNGRFLGKDLAPIFPPSVMGYKPQMEAAAEQYGVPVNFLATIMTIESTGDPNAHSGADAWGLMQIVPAYHFEDFQDYLPDGASLPDYTNAQAENGNNVVPLTTYEAVFTNAELNINSGAKFLAQCIQTAAQSNGLSLDSPITYSWAGHTTTLVKVTLEDNLAPYHLRALSTVTT